MSWSQLRHDVAHHAKTRHLARLLRVSRREALGLIADLWCLCGPTHGLTTLSVEQLEIGLEWEGEPGACVAALLRAGWLDSVPRGYLCHDWDEYAGSSKWAVQKRNQRERQKDVRGQSADGPHVSALQTDRQTYKEEKSAASSAEPDSLPHEQLTLTTDQATDEPSLLAFPCVGRGAQTWHLRQRHVEEWSLAYPGVAVEQECRKALAWLQASPRRRKTHDGMTRFLVGWLGRAQNKRNETRPQSRGRLSAAQQFEAARRQG